MAKNGERFAVFGNNHVHSFVKLSCCKISTPNILSSFYLHFFSTVYADEDSDLYD